MPPLWLVAAILLTLAQFALPARWAFVPLWIAACHTPYTSFLGGVTICRLVIAAGLLRAITTQQHAHHSQIHPIRPINDSLIIAFALVLIASAAAHETSPLQNPLISRLRMVFDITGAYAYMRCWSLQPDAAKRWAIAMVAILTPFAFLLLLESLTATNPYRWIGSEHVFSQIRDGRIRAQGPFGTPILSGTVGAVTFPLLLPLWHTNRRICIAGSSACILIILTSGSSGPISSLLVAIAFLACWRWKNALHSFAAVTAAGLVLLHFIKERPIWYLMALMDFVGGSTGWHRAYLIDVALAHLDEWWLAGCDRTSHWMPYALAAVPNHCDLTNYYLHLGVTAGFFPIVLLLAILTRAIPPSQPTHPTDVHSDPVSEPTISPLRWCLTAALFAHAVTFLSISYFDQISVFFWGLLGAIPAFLATENLATCGFSPAQKPMPGQPKL